MNLFENLSLFFKSFSWLRSYKAIFLHKAVDKLSSMWILEYEIAETQALCGAMNNGKMKPFQRTLEYLFFADAFQ